MNGTSYATAPAEGVKDYNEERPHDSLGGLSPIMYKKQKLLGFSSATLHFSQEALLNV